MKTALLLIGIILGSCRAKLVYTNDHSPNAMERRSKMIYKNTKMMQRKMNRARKFKN